MAMAKRRRISRERFQKPCCLKGLVKASKDLQAGHIYTSLSLSVLRLS